MMNRFFTLLLTASCLTAVGQVPDYVPTEGLIGWWPLHESLNDLGPNGFDATSSEEEYFCTDLDSFCSLELNEESPDVFLTSGLALNGTGGGITCAAWLRLDDMGSSNWKIAIDLTDGNSNNAWGDRFVQSIARSEDTFFWSSGGHFDNNINVDYGLDTPYPIEEGIWYHFASTWDFEGNLTHYIQGQPIDSTDVSDIGDFFLVGGNEGSRKIGSRAHNSDPNLQWVGGIRDIGFWQRPLSSQEVAFVFNQTALVSGCTDAEACNYNEDADIDDGSCYPCEIPASHCGSGTIWDENTQTCIVANPADINLDGCVQLNDLLDLLSAYGDCGAEESAWQCGDPLEYQGYDYETVQIGGQCWFAENLRAASYENGDLIQSALSDSEWEVSNEGASAVYGENNSFCQNLGSDFDVCIETLAEVNFGMLYNWHAINDARGVCPLGWSVPSDEDWFVLTAGLGGDEIAGDLLKSQVGWPPSGNGSNASGFEALPGGTRLSDGGFFSGGAFGYWWSSSLNNLGRAWLRELDESSAVYRDPNGGPLNVGISVRCIKDAE